MKSVPLAEVCEIQMGQAPKGDSYNNNNEGLPLIAGAGDFGDIVPSPGKFTSSPSKVSQRGDIILCIRATIGDLNYSDAEYCLGRGVAGLRVNSTKLDARYLWQWISANKAGLAKKGKGSTFKQVSRSDISEWEISLPDTLEEQRRIAAILDKADAIRQKRKSALTLADTFLRATFLDMFGDPVTNPKGWDIVELQSLFDVIVDCLHTTPKHFETPSCFPSLRTSDLQNGYIQLDTAKYVTESEYNARNIRHKPVPGNIVYSREGERFGIAALIPEGMTACLGQRTMLFQVKENNVTPEFAWALLNSKGMYHQAKSRVGGATSPHVNIGDIRKFKAIIPPYEMQVKFSATSRKYFQMRTKHAGLVLDAETLFASLSQRAFKGEL